MARRNLLHEFTRNDNERLVDHVSDDRSMAHDEHVLEEEQALEDFPVQQRSTILPPVTETRRGDREVWSINGQDFNKLGYSREQAQTEYMNRVSAVHDTRGLVQHSIFSAPVDEAKRHLDLDQGADYISRRLLRMHAALSSEE